MAQLPAEAQAATEAIERQTLRAALDASSIDELEYLKAIKDAPPTGAEVDRKAMRKAIANNYKDLRNWPANQKLDEGGLSPSSTRSTGSVRPAGRTVLTRT